MKVLSLIADFLIGWHQGRQVRHRRAELVWRGRLEALKRQRRR